MSDQYRNTGTEHTLWVRGSLTSQEEMRWHATQSDLRGEPDGRDMAASVLVLLDLVEAYQDLTEHMASQAALVGRIG